MLSAKRGISLAVRKAEGRGKGIGTNLTSRTSIKMWLLLCKAVASKRCSRGEPLGSEGLGCFSRGERHSGRSAPNGGRRCVTDIQQAVPAARSAGRGFHAYSAKHLDTLVQRAGLSPQERLAVRAVASVLPFRTNSYVVENLIDWDAAPDDPIYRLVFPQPDMLPAADVRRLADRCSSSPGRVRPAMRTAVTASGSAPSRSRTDRNGSSPTPTPTPS